MSNMHASRPPITSTPQPERPAHTRSRLTNGADLLPTVDQRSTWARMFRDLVETMADHCGGADYLSEPQRMTCRRIAAMEVELVHLEAKFAQQRADGQQPDAAALDLYGRLTNSQKRLFELIGLNRKPRDLVPDPLDYARNIAA